MDGANNKLDEDYICIKIFRVLRLGYKLMYILKNISKNETK